MIIVAVWESRENRKGKEMLYLTTHSTHFIYGYLASDILLRTILIVKKETRCRHIGYSLRLTARVLLYAPSHRQDNTYHGLWYTSRGALVGTRNSSMDPPHEGSIRRPIAPWANALTTELHLAPGNIDVTGSSHCRYICISLKQCLGMNAFSLERTSQHNDFYKRCLHILSGGLGAWSKANNNTIYTRTLKKLSEITRPPIDIN